MDIWKIDQVDALREEFLSRLLAASTAQQLEEVRVAYMGSNGRVQLLTRQIGQVPAEQRAHFGKAVNALKAEAQRAYQEARQRLEASGERGRAFDPTYPAVPVPRGTLHPITQTIRTLTRIFRELGFEVVEGREVETEFHNFTALNIPLDHPSREAFDTFYTTQGHLLRSQTSTVQIRIMETRKPPLRLVAPGRVYRPDTVDASHSFMFHQIEGLMVDEATTFADLKGVIDLALRRLFGVQTRTRFRPHFFPFTEPSAEVDVSCLFCKGRGCSVCGRSGWLEVAGAGLVDPAVFAHVKIDARRVQGFAFGLGVERIAMLRHGIHDIRLFYENDLRFLSQF